MSNVVPLKPRPQLTWICTHCNCGTFHLFDDGTIKCAGCKTEGDSKGEWVKFLPPPPDEAPARDDGDVVNTLIWAGKDLARRRVLRSIQDWDKDIAILGVWHKDGTMRVWHDCDDDWAVRKITEAIFAIEGPD